MIRFQMKTFIQQALEKCRCCTICFSPEVYDIIVFPLRETEMGVEVAAFGFCEYCLSNVDSKTIGRHVMRRINAGRGEGDEMPVIDDQGKVTGIILPNGDVLTMQ